jgi:hypothetical protein
LGFANFPLAVCLALVTASIIYFGQHKFIYSDHNFNSSLFEKATERLRPSFAKEFVIVGSWSENWTWVDGRAKQYPVPENLSACFSWHQRIVFAGDSQMGYLFNSFVELVRRNYSGPGVCKVVDKSSRCSHLEYFGLQRASTWIRPNFTGLEGPIAHGLENFWCSDLGCHVSQRKSCDLPMNHSLDIEMLVIEFALDVEQQSTRYNTTQENAHFYLQKSKPMSTALVLNVGVHDLILAERHFAVNLKKLNASEMLRFCSFVGDKYEANLLWYLGLIKAMIPRLPVLILATSPVQNEERNALVEELNKRASSVARRSGFPFFQHEEMLRGKSARLLYSDWVHAYKQVCFIPFQYDSHNVFTSTFDHLCFEVLKTFWFCW